MKYLIVVCVVLSSLNLSHRPAGATHGPTEQLISLRSNTGRWIDNPTGGYHNLDYNLEREDFQTPKRPVPYAEIWDNPLDQTAQQYVAILSLFGGQPLPDDIFRLIKIQQETRIMETLRTGILTSRLAPQPQANFPEPEIPDTVAWILIILGTSLFLIGAYVNWRSVRMLRRSNRL